MTDLKTQLREVVESHYGGLEKAKNYGLGQKLLALLGVETDPLQALDVPTKPALDAAHVFDLEGRVMAAGQHVAAELTVKTREMLALLSMLDRADDAVRRLQADATAAKEATIERQVRAFHSRFGHPIATTPHVPDEKAVRFRMSLVTEEYLEFMNACLDQQRMADDSLEEHEKSPRDEYPWSEIMRDAKHSLKLLIDEAPIKVDLVELADATIDLDYVIEGTRVVFGIWRAPLAAEVHRANMEKDPTYVTAKDDHHRSPLPTFPVEVLERLRRPDPTQKPTKPASWRAPDIKACLEAQGWRAA